MNERSFLKKLNSKVNTDGDLTPAIVEELLSEGQALVVRKRIPILSAFFKRKSPRQIIEDNFQTILDKTSYLHLNTLLERLMQNCQTSEIVKEKFDMIIKRFSFTPEERKNGITGVFRSFKLDFLRMCKMNYTYAEDLLVKHIDAIIQGGITIEELRELRISEEVEEKLNKKLESQKQEIASEMLSNISLTGKSEKAKQQLINDYIPTITRIIEELLSDQNVRMVDIEAIGTGTYSKVYQVKDKVLKIGKPRETYKIPNHPRILQPLTRTNLIDERDENKIFGCIEIADRVDKLQEEELQIEKLYQVYKELRDDGIVWTDARFANVGKLRSRNMPKLNGKDMDVDPVAVGMDKETKERILEAGEWVVIDTDFIYREKESSIEWPTNSYSERFEKRWQQERQGKIAKQFQREEIGKAQEDCTKSYERRTWEKGRKGGER